MVWAPVQSAPPADTGHRDFSGCGIFILAAPFFSVWMDIIRLGIIVGVMIKGSKSSRLPRINHFRHQITNSNPFIRFKTLSQRQKIAETVMTRDGNTPDIPSFSFGCSLSLAKLRQSRKFQKSQFAIRIPWWNWTSKKIGNKGIRVISCLLQPVSILSDFQLI